MVFYIILIGLVVSVLLYNIALERTTEELYELFNDDEERWWHHREIERALGRRELLVTHALRRIGKEAGIATKFLYLGGIEHQIPGGKLSRGIFVAFYRLKRGGGGGKKRVSKSMQVRRSRGALVYTKSSYV